MIWKISTKVGIPLNSLKLRKNQAKNGYKIGLILLLDKLSMKI